MSVAPKPAEADRIPAYGIAFTDWLACACAGATERASRAVRASGTDLLSDIAFVATAGHVLDFDDTYAEGVAHVSAATAPAALVLAAHLDLSLEAALAAYADGFEAMAAVVAASHPALYDAGWHPTAVCGPVGAAVAASRLLGLDEDQREHALAAALLRAGGARGAFGSDGKSIQVGLASAAGVQAALLAQAGATIAPGSVRGPLSFEAVTGACVPRASRGALGLVGDPPAIVGNWIKPYPSCLGTHGAIAGAARLRADGHTTDGEPLTVVVHPVARQAAHRDDVDDGLSAKFSIPYCVAHTLRHGPPGIRDFDRVDPAVRSAAQRIAVTSDSTVPEFGAALTSAGRELARVEHPPGSPERPLTRAELRRKVADLAGERLDGLLDDGRLPARDVLARAGLRTA